MKSFVLLIFLSLSTTLHADWFDWLYHSEISQTKEFNCPHRCGEWGTKEIEEVEWNFIKALYFLDGMSIYTFDYYASNAPDWRIDYSEPNDSLSKWYREMDYFDRVGNMYSDGGFRYSRLCYNDHNVYPEKKDLTIYWGIHPVYTREGKVLGHIFMRKKCGFFPDSKNTYKCLDRKEYRFNQASDVLQAYQIIMHDVDCISFCYAINKHSFIDKYQEEYFKKIHHYLANFNETYLSIFINCAEEHQAPAAYLMKARLNFELGNDIDCISDIETLFKISSPEIISEKVSEELQLKKGTAECELSLLDEAIVTLSNYIESHPNHKKAYLERAIAQFEKGDFHSAVEDFAASGFTGTPVSPNYRDELAFSTGLVKGLAKGAYNSLEDLAISVSSIQSISHGLWALVTKPEEVSRSMVHACKNAIDFMRKEGVEGTAFVLFPELKTLIEKGDRLSYSQQGELFGIVVGQLGIDYLLLKGAGKGVKAYRDLREANAILTLKQMSSSLEAHHILATTHSKWWSKTSPIIDHLKANKGTLLDREIAKAFKTQNLSEHQVRQILHHSGFRTFPKPEGIPKNWGTAISNKNGGMKYVYSKNNQFQVRVMPGDPSSNWPSQRNPYVIHKTDKGFLGKDGKIYSSNKNANTHIPLEEYDFNKYTKLVPYHD